MIRNTLKGMKMADILSSHYSQLCEICRDNERMISRCRTDEDWLQDTCLTALRKFKDKDISEEEGLNYLMKSVKQALIYKWKKIDNTILLMGDMELKDI